MKALLSFALLVCMLFSMSASASVKPPVRKVMKTEKRAISWPITGTRSGIAYTISGAGNTPSYIHFSGYGPFVFTQDASGSWIAGIPSSSPLYPTVRGVIFQPYSNAEGYLLTFHPDL